LNAAVCNTFVPGNKPSTFARRKEEGANLRIIAMQQTSSSKPLSLSDFIRDPDAVVKDFNEIPDDDDIEYVKEYGIGIDCHSKFIEICIRYRNGQVIQKAQAHFSTNWDDLVAARDWCINVLKC
jgi:hypothetical protein